MTGEFTAAVHAVVFLNHKARSMTSEEIAENVCTNPARVRKIMAKLKKAGLVQTKEGAVHGGYAFVHNAKTVSLLQIFRAVDTRVVTAPWKSGNPDMDCLIASGMADVMGGVIDRMDEAGKKILETITVADLDRQIFHKQKGNQNETV